MKNLKGFAFVSSLCFAVTSVAFAADEGGFVEGSIGSTTFDIANTSGFTLNKTSSSWSVMAGYMANKYIGVEAGYLDLGKASGSISATGSAIVSGQLFVGTANLSFNADSKGWLLGARGNLPINDQFSLNGRIGQYMWTVDTRATASVAGTLGGAAIAAGSTATKRFSNSDLYYGVGAKYNISKQLAVGLGYSNFKMGKEIDTKASNWDANLNYRF